MDIYGIKIDIDKNIRKYGEKCTVPIDGKNIDSFVAVKKIWKHNKSKFESTKTKIGLVDHDYYSACFLDDTDVTKLDEFIPLIVSGVPYLCIKAEPVIVGGQIIYYWAILKNYQPEEDMFG